MDVVKSLYNAWMGVRSDNSLQSNEEWKSHYQKFDSILQQAGEKGVLNELFEETMGEMGTSEDMTSNIDDFISHIEGDDTDDDPLPLFHEDVVANLCAKMEMVKEDGEVDTEMRSHLELFALPVFGDHNTICSLSRREGFAGLVRKSKLCHENSNVVLLGALPADLAAMHILNPQKIHDTTKLLHEALLRLPHEAHFQETLKNVAEDWDAKEDGSHSENTMKIGGYIVLGAYLSVTNINEEEHFLNIQGPTEQQVELWSTNFEAWKERQVDKNMLDACSIGGPSPLREAVAIALGEYIYTSLAMQTEMGQQEKLSKIELCVPNEDIGHDDITMIYGINEQGQVAAHIKMNALSLGLLIPEILETWMNCDESCDIAITPMAIQNMDYSKPRMH